MSRQNQNHHFRLQEKESMGKSLYCRSVSRIDKGMGMTMSATCGGREETIPAARLRGFWTRRYLGHTHC